MRVCVARVRALQIDLEALSHQLDVAAGDWVRGGETLGAVGSTGNAAGKPPHLHYTIITLVPYPWRVTAQPQGWQKMFFLDPGAEIAD